MDSEEIEFTHEKNILNDDDVNPTDNGLLFNPYNNLNKEITLNNVQSILSKYGIQSIPTLMIFKKGEPIATKIGGVIKSELLTWIKTSI